MQKIKITNKTLAQEIKVYARKHKISFQKACEKLFDVGVCHLQKKDGNLKKQKAQIIDSYFDVGGCHPCRVRKITIIEVEVA